MSNKIKLTDQTLAFIKTAVNETHLYQGVGPDGEDVVAAIRELRDLAASLVADASVSGAVTMIPGYEMDMQVDRRKVEALRKILP